VAISEKAFSLVEEFTDFLLFDDIRKSIVVNVKRDYVKTIKLELSKLHYDLVHQSTIEGSISYTLVFVKEYK